MLQQKNKKPLIEIEKPMEVKITGTKRIIQIKNKKIPVHSFYLAKGAKANFEKISN